MTSLSTSRTSAHAAQVVRLPNIAFIGKAGAGKTTAADLLVEAFGYRRLSFAGPLKDVAAMLWGEEARTDRGKLQGLGVAVREIEADTWVNLLVRQVEDGDSRPVVVDDCRFENEWWALQGAGFVLVRIVVDRIVRINRLRGNGKLQDESQLEHVSETAVDHLRSDHLISNSGLTGEFYNQIADVLTKELRRR